MKRRTARTIVVWIALLLLIASWLYSYLYPDMDSSPFPPIPGIAIPSEINWGKLLLRVVFIDLTIIAVAAGFLFTFRGGNDS
jgi:hypothetical protein